jgi:hypothetical protein
MGQLVAVTEKASSNPGLVRFETNRSLTGMGHERFASVDDAYSSTPSAELARRLFATGKVAAVHVYSNIITVDLGKGQTSDGLADTIREMYRYWMPGMQPPAFDDVTDETEGGDGAADDGGGGGGGGDADPALAEAANLVPMHLLERSRAARERWKSKNA